MTYLAVHQHDVDLGIFLQKLKRMGTINRLDNLELHTLNHLSGKQIKYPDTKAAVAAE